MLVENYPYTREILADLNFVQYKPFYSSLEELKKDIIPLPEHTLLPEEFFEQFMSYLLKHDSIRRGSWIQIGAWRGGGTLFLASLRKESKANGKLHVIDTFGNIPTKELKKEKDLAFVNFFQIKSPIINYKIIVEKLLGRYYLLENINLIETEIGSLSYDFKLDMVTFIFVDVDFYEPTLESLYKTYDLLVVGGVILIDDYYSPFFNCKDAVDEFFNEKKITGEVSFEPFSNNVLMVHKHA